MGKAKRFNSYDASVAEHRKVLQNYGQARQNLSIGSSFRAMPLSVPTPSGIGPTGPAGGGGGGISFPITPTINDHGNVGTTTEDLDLSASTGHVHKITLTGNPTLTFSNPPTSGTQMEFEIEFVQDATGGRTVTWPASVAETVTISTTASATTIVTVRTNDGGTTYHAIPALRGTISLGGLLLSNVSINTDFDADGTYKFVLDTDADTYIIGDTDDQIEVFTGGSERLRITTEVQLQGGVNLDLNGNDLIFGTGTGEYMDHGAASNIRVYTSSTHRLSFDATGQLMESGYRLTMNDEIRFTGITKPGTNISSKIYAENLTNDELVLNAATSGKIRMDIAGTEIAEFGTVEAQFQSTLGYDFTVYRDDASPSDDENISTINFQGNDDGAGSNIFASIEVSQADVSAGSEDGRIKFGVIDGSLENGTFMKLESFAGEGNLALQSDEKEFVIEVIRDEATNDTGQIGAIEFITNDTLSNATQFGKIRVDADTTTDGSESATFTFQAYNAGSQDTFLEYTGGTGIVILDTTTDKLGFYGGSGSARQTLAGARDDPEAALAGLITLLENLNILVDTTTAS